jgi:hypothetical protein
MRLGCCADQYERREADSSFSLSLACSLTRRSRSISRPPDFCVYGADAVSIDTAAENLRPVPCKYRGKKWGLIYALERCFFTQYSLPLAPFSQHASRDAEFAPLILSYFSVMRARRSMLGDYTTALLCQS